ncbi:MAG TPA: antitoxin [Elusimicrobia bacterium]|nr:MAG: antitoxin [Candidatus Rokubacteria bacterium GWA2_70_23]OGK90049.1 MAG: antitoxin [Candidatus Rokubacteria bacterium GWC2_70_24]OGK90508.1 MAG: antitoxin [Candidatus Rokubacteria bacterium GWF2_70_14]HAM59736.1 antitoxin [Candidatus Rokubacteria bacterium]HBL15276.1 antitoxin [Elusimicrobiota bacterium]
MPRVDWKARVVMDPEVHHGDPCIKGTRVPVSIIVGSIADGMGLEEVRAAYPQLSVEDIRAALAYAAEVLQREVIIPLAG